MVAPPYPPRARGSPPDFRYYFALVVKNQIVYLAMADKSISDIEAAHRFLKDILTKCALHVSEQNLMLAGGRSVSRVASLACESCR